ncbi:MAG: DUF2851 family protein [Bacteroidales bacterium]
MNEQLLQYLWKFGLFDKEQARTTTGERVEVLSCGVQNFDAGPDFSQAKIKIGNTLWIGNVEVHCRASDWLKHAHQNNKAYDNVILHVVQTNDCTPVYNTSGAPIPTIELLYNKTCIVRYQQLMDAQDFVPCRSLLPHLEVFKLRMFLTRLAIERLEHRCLHIEQLVENEKTDWERVFQHILFRAFGFGVNSDAFEQLSQTISPTIIVKHRNNLLQLEALLFGQAGFLQNEAKDEYQVRLQQEYAILRAKFSLSSMELHQWKFMRIRPVNFPTVRIAQLASFLQASSSLISNVLEIKTKKDIETIFSIDPSEYWTEHYHFSKQSDKQQKSLGQTSIAGLVANFVVPMQFAYGRMCNNSVLCDNAIALLEQFAGEKNTITRGWKSMGVNPCNMFESQALIELKQEYCDKKRCLHCTIGMQALSANK